MLDWTKFSHADKINVLLISKRSTKTNILTDMIVTVHSHIAAKRSGNPPFWIFSNQLEPRAFRNSVTVNSYTESMVLDQEKMEVVDL